MPLFAKDDVKAALYSVLGAEDVDASRRLSRASFDVLGAIAHAVFAARGAAVVEANFTRGEAEHVLRGACTHQVRVWCEVGENLRRYRERQRAPMHFDDHQLARLERGLREGWYEPLDLGVPVLEVETTRGWAPGYEEVLAFAAS